MNIEIADIPAGARSTRRVGLRGKYDSLWRELLLLTEGKALRLPGGLSAEGKEYKSLVWCLRHRAYVRWKDRSVRLCTHIEGDGAYLWLEPHQGG
jgi:hypothetical protein